MNFDIAPELQALRADTAKAAVVAAPAETAAEPVAVAATEPVAALPDFANVGVIRGGQRAEYRVLMILGQ